MRIAGKIPNNQQVTELRVILAGQEKMRFPAHESAPVMQAKQDYVNMQLNSLLGDIHTNKDAIEEIGIKNSLATPYTTLMVLENIEDYAQYGIEPPAGIKGRDTYARFRKEWLAEEEENKPTINNIEKYLLAEREGRSAW